jgi:hypothetical protein
VANGVKLLEKGRLDAAHREFRISLGLDPGCAMAHRGEAVLFGIRRDFKAAFAACHRAIRFTTPEDLRSPLQDVIGRSSSVRWDRNAGRSHGDRGGETAYLARLFVVEVLNAYYRMGVAFKLHGQHRGEGEVLTSALSLTNAFSREASQHLAAAGDLDRFSLRTPLGRGVVFLEQVSRGEAAALLVREIDLVELLGASGRGEADHAGAPERPPDLEGHPLAEDVCTVMSMGIDGFAPLGDGNFHPESPIRRADYAAAAADILGRANRGRQIVDEGPRLSPFEDVPLSSPRLRAAAACAELGVLAAEEGRFRPAEPLSGEEAAGSVHRLKELMHRE